MISVYKTGKIKIPRGCLPEGFSGSACVAVYPVGNGFELHGEYDVSKESVGSNREFASTGAAFIESVQDGKEAIMKANGTKNVGEWPKLKDFLGIGPF